MPWDAASLDQSADRAQRYSNPGLVVPCHGDHAVEVKSKVLNTAGHAHSGSGQEVGCYNGQARGLLDRSGNGSRYLIYRIGGLLEPTVGVLSWIHRWFRSI